MKLIQKIAIFSAGIGLVFSSCTSESTTSARRIDYVNNFIGTAFTGHTYPGVSQPFAMIQPGPDTGVSDWEHCGGYVYGDSTILGFSQTHLCGVGCMSCGDILIQPFSGPAVREDYACRYSKDSEVANPGYYGVTVGDEGIRVDITASRKVAFYRFTYPEATENRLFIDTQHGIIKPKRASRRILEGDFRFEDSVTVCGYIRAKEWSTKRIYFVMQFDQPYREASLLPKRTPEERGTRATIRFDAKCVQAKIALSSTSIEGAKLNLASDMNGWNFAQARTVAENEWERYLSLIDITGSDEQKAVFYTAMYHLFTQPCDMADVDGHYRGIDDRIASLGEGRPYYSNLSLWDTYRAANPLYTILTPEIVDDLVNSMVAHHEGQGYLPIWPLWGQETYCMIANHAIPVIVEAYNKGFRGFDVERAYRAIRETSFREDPTNRKSPWTIYEKYGYYPMDLIRFESVSRTLETAYDDYCGAQMARALGHEEDYEHFMKRAGYIRNLFDPSIGFFRGRKSDGTWETPFDPLNVCHNSNGKGSFTEGNAWQYLWHVQHDVPAFMELMGGKEKFTAKLDSLFTMESVVYGDGRVAAITGMIGQYAHGNEPGHHTPYFWRYTDKPWRGQEIIREIVSTKYANAHDGVCGNEDMGQMSAWYIFSCMGFYPLNPVSGEYVFGAPQLPSITVNLPSGKKFSIIARNLSEANKYIASITLNGRPYDKDYITHADILAGGELVFDMTNKY